MGTCAHKVIQEPDCIHFLLPHGKLEGNQLTLAKMLEWQQLPVCNAVIFCVGSRALHCPRLVHTGPHSISSEYTTPDLHVTSAIGSPARATATALAPLLPPVQVLGMWLARQLAGSCHPDGLNMCSLVLSGLDGQLACVGFVNKKMHLYLIGGSTCNYADVTQVKQLKLGLTAHVLYSMKRHVKSGFESDGVLLTLVLSRYSYRSS